MRSANAALTVGSAWSAPSTVSEPMVARASSGGNVGCDGGEAEHADVEHLAGVSRRFQIMSREMAEAKLELPALGGRARGLAVPLQLVPNGGADEVGPVAVEPLAHKEVDIAEIDIAEIDRDLLTIQRLGRLLGHASTPPSTWMVSGGMRGALQGANGFRRTAG